MTYTLRSQRATAIFLLLWLGCWNLSQAMGLDRGTTVREGDGDYVVLVHGVNWLRDTLKPVEKHLNGLGYHTVHVHYTSRKVTADDVASRIDSAIAENCTDAERKIHFVGHSLGGIMIRHYLKEHVVTNLGHTILIATPNQGTELAETLQRTAKPIRKAFGETVEKLGTESDSLPNTLGEPDFEPGVIMGSKTAFPFFSPILPGVDDGIVTVEAGKLERMRDFLVTPTTHLSIVRNKEVLRQISFFLEKGKFDPAARETDATPTPPEATSKLVARTERRSRPRFGRGRWR